MVKTQKRKNKIPGSSTPKFGSPGVVRAGNAGDQNKGHQSFNTKPVTAVRHKG